MSGVKRYGPTCDCMSEMSWGDYVKLSDYDQLLANYSASCSLYRSVARERDTLRTANQRLEQEISDLKMTVAEQSARQFVGHDDQRHIDDLVAAGIRASDAERLRLEGDVARLREALELWLTGYDEVAASPNFEPFPHVAERVAKTRAALRGNGVS
jgi:hypothetical protein